MYLYILYHLNDNENRTIGTFTPALLVKGNL